jgi:serine/threonine protein kinase
MQVVLIDFKCMTCLHSFDALARSQVGFLKFRPPELVENLGVNRTINSWQLGCCLYQMAMGK